MQTTMFGLMEMCAMIAPPGGQVFYCNHFLIPLKNLTLFKLMESPLATFMQSTFRVFQPDIPAGDFLRTFDVINNEPSRGRCSHKAPGLSRMMSVETEIDLTMIKNTN